MPRAPKCFIKGTPIEICTSVQTGLPFVVAAYMEVLIQGALANAQRLYPLIICHLMVMRNHIHLLAVVKNPTDVKGFMDSFKTELAHSINTLLGNTGISFWKSGYDSPVVLSPEKFIERMLYLYLNPVEANLVSTSKQYPGISTLDILLKGKQEHIERCKKVSRDAVPELSREPHSIKEQHKFAQLLRDSRGQTHELKIEPWAWLECFNLPATYWNKKVLLQEFKQKLRAEEERLSRQRQTPVAGAEMLMLQDPREEYRSKRGGKRMFCLSHCIEQRRVFILWFKEEAKKAREAFLRWRDGDLNSVPPPGFYFPGGVLFSNLFLPAFRFLDPVT
jgi:REP element-mobilizing transposase RayT